ncbi:MAG: hypothetical protein Q7K39_04920 [Candidatus Magasanikbacteria bacterium]|nr:hypothetical protein [Candidatus Magasanikbacteria bacterium]
MLEGKKKWIAAAVGLAGLVGVEAGRRAEKKTPPRVTDESADVAKRPKDMREADAIAEARRVLDEDKARGERAGENYQEDYEQYWLENMEAKFDVAHAEYPILYKILEKSPYDFTKDTLFADPPPRLYLWKKVGEFEGTPRALEGVFVLRNADGTLGYEIIPQNNLYKPDGQHVIFTAEQLLQELQARESVESQLVEDRGSTDEREASEENKEE